MFIFYSLRPGKFRARVSISVSVPIKLSALGHRRLKRPLHHGPLKRKIRDIPSLKPTDILAWEEKARGVRMSAPELEILRYRPCPR